MKLKKLKNWANFPTVCNLCMAGTNFKYRPLLLQSLWCPPSHNIPEGRNARIKGETRKDIYVREERKRKSVSTYTDVAFPFQIFLISEIFLGLFYLFSGVISTNQFHLTQKTALLCVIAQVIVEFFCVIALLPN